MDMNGVVKVNDITRYRVAIYEAIRRNEKRVKGLSVEVKEIRPEFVKIAWKKNGKTGSFKVRVVEYDNDGHIAVDGFPSRGERVMWFVLDGKPFDDCCSDTVEGAIKGVITGFVA